MLSSLQNPLMQNLTESKGSQWIFVEWRNTWVYPWLSAHPDPSDCLVQAGALTTSTGFFWQHKGSVPSEETSMGVTGACTWLHCERQVKCSLEPWPPLSQHLLEYPLTCDNWSGAVLEKALCAAKCPRVPMLGSTPGTLWLNAIPEPHGQRWGSQAQPPGRHLSLGSFVVRKTLGIGVARVLAYEGAEFVAESALDLEPEQLDVVSVHRWLCELGQVI